MHRRLVLLLPLLRAAPARASTPAAWGALLPGARPVGEGVFRWFGLAVYDARLWAPGGRYDAAAPHLLVLSYRVAIPRERLVETSLDEMARVAGPIAEDVRQRWAARLRTAFPDVQAGDALAGLHRPGEGFSVHAAQGERARFDDPAFAAAFFGIWLDPRTRAPALRRSLLGGVS